MTIRSPHHVDIVDIRRDKPDESLLQLMLKGLQPAKAEARQLPTLLLYDEHGLKLFEQITYLKEYYLTNAEIEVLETCGGKIAERIPNGCRLVELGSGNLRKINILLNACERARKTVEYFALDLSLSELERTFSEIPVNDFRHVKFSALHGTYDDGLAWLSKTVSPTTPTCVLTLGSSIGNFSREEAASFLQSFAHVLGSADLLLVGLDACQVPERVYKAYNDDQGLTHRFYRNGLDHANKLLGHKAFKQEDWEIVGRYNEVEGRHEAFYQALIDVSVSETKFKKGDMLKLEDAYKYSANQSDKLWHAARLVKQTAFANQLDDYHIHLLSPARVIYPTDPDQYAARPVPTVMDWQDLWVAWDTVTRAMIPKDELMDKPIKLRNSLIFYLGHIPTFAGKFTQHYIHMTRATAGKPTKPAYYMSIFERGIDPDVDNPELCHAHSEVPDTWPALEEILEYQARVRERIRELTDIADSDRKVGRALWLAFEHEAMHLETFLYMLLQSERVLPPPGRAAPDFKSLAAEARRNRVANKWHSVPASTITLGLDDPENDLGPDRFFGWDNERPSRKTAVAEFEAQARPISNGEYARFLDQSGFELLPASWSVPVRNGTSNEVNGILSKGSENGYASHTRSGEPSEDFIRGKFVRTVYGPVPLEYALDWPVMASYDELAAFAKWSHGRIPTLEEVRSIYNYVDLTKKEAAKVSSSLISAVNGHLSNNGVEETPPQGDSCNGFPHGKQNLNREDLFIDLEGCNVGFQHWHPTSVTHKGDNLCGQADTGGLWEWTSSPLADFQGFKPMDLYPGYTSDFFDGKHNIILGGSWATHPRIAGRKTFVNWYQRNYPYTWATARLVRSI